MAKKPSPKPALPPIAIFHGPEAFLRQQKTSQLREALAKEHGKVDVVVFDGASAQAADVLDECRSMGLIAAHKVVILDSAEQLIKEAVRPLFERYAENPAEGATLVIRSHAWKAGNLDKFVAASGGVVTKCVEPSEDEAVRWTIDRAKEAHGAAIAPDAAQALVSRTGPALSRLDSELAKLAAAAGKDGITRALVSELVGASREEDAWSIQKTLLTGEPEAALAHLRHVLDVSRQPVPLVMYSMMDLARKLHGACRGLKAGVNPGLLFKSLRLWGSSGDAVFKAARQLSPSQTRGFLRSCVRADQRCKSGLSEPDRALEMLVVELQGLLGQPAPAPTGRN